MKIAIIDYDIGNVQSIKNSLRSLEEFDIVITNNENEILEADGVILPGVGAFKKGMEELKIRNLPKIINKYVSTGKPLFGICLGMQLLFDKGEEFGSTQGLGLLEGSVKKFPKALNAKLPHISWNEIEYVSSNWKGSILKGINDKEDMYFIHSYICMPDDESIILSKTEYGGINFCSSIKKDNIYACQFHPEKSGKSGLKIIRAFIDIVKQKL
jgi:imidazole glycerol-phosphate synthase subunit HisH